MPIEQAFDALSPALHSLTLYLGIGGALILIILHFRARVRRDYDFIESVFLRSALYILSFGLALVVVLIAARS